MKRLKIYLSLISFFCVNSFMFAQVGVNTETPAATLEVVAGSTGATTAEGFIAPRLTGDQLAGKNAQYAAAQNGAIVYVTDVPAAPAGKTIGITASGYYYYDATANNGAGANSGLWIPLSGIKKPQFYMPSVVLPVKGDALPNTTNYTYSNGVFTVNLFNIYKTQYGTPQAKSLSSATLSVGAAATAFDYFILYYDPSVYTSVTVSTAGVLSYSIVADYSVSEKTFMNIMFKEK
ncbi:hypothetical protein CLV62_10276 [Dysgonomonas alginatilytica]|uniref:Cleaved adhesin domain-containing protein n=1 Tax=Dysgonomonas alginatilytica TaxID=1605892 RepID=A0A2V3PUI0_9BACT|nr:hypothetical protein [Dysgonomonas alginatilytica]PXV68046.1 hypothetical protein CLV62_10276 [Dysgonomonas alginatilytica]